MKKIKQRKIKGQSALEMGIAISLTLIVVMATVRVWQWGTSEMSERYAIYKVSRQTGAIESIDNRDFGEQIRPGPIKDLNLVPN